MRVSSSTWALAPGGTSSSTTTSSPTITGSTAGRLGVAGAEGALHLGAVEAVEPEGGLAGELETAEGEVDAAGAGGGQAQPAEAAAVRQRVPGGGVRQREGKLFGAAELLHDRLGVALPLGLAGEDRLDVGRRRHLPGELAQGPQQRAFFEARRQRTFAGVSGLAAGAQREHGEGQLETAERIRKWSIESNCRNLPLSAVTSWLEAAGGANAAAHPGILYQHRNVWRSR